MRIVCISDTHGMIGMLDMPRGDVLIHAGDLSSRGRLNEELQKLAAFPHKHKLVIAGNHDWCFERDIADVVIPDGVTYLCDEETIIDGVKFYGSPWQPEFGRWAFNLPRGPALADKWAQIPEDTDVLITHGPPEGILDEVLYPAGEHVGCADLLERVRIVRPKLHVFGHIHESYGVDFGEDTTFINASICTRKYFPENPPIVFTLNS